MPSTWQIRLLLCGCLTKKGLLFTYGSSFPRTLRIGYWTQTTKGGPSGQMDIKGRYWLHFVKPWVERWVLHTERLWEWGECLVRAYDLNAWLRQETVNPFTWLAESGPRNGVTSRRTLCRNWTKPLLPQNNLVYKTQSRTLCRLYSKTTKELVKQAEATSWWRHFLLRHHARERKARGS